MTRLLDAHVHFWDPAARHHDWLSSIPALQRSFGHDDLDPGRHELTGVVFVQADCRDDEALDEARWVATIATAYPAVRGIVAYAPLHLGAGADRHLGAVTQLPLVVGVRWLLQGHPVAMLRDPALIAGLRLLPEFGLSFDICATHDQLPAVASLVRLCPETMFVLDHLGKPAIARGEFDPWRSDLAALAVLPNVVCKLSGLTTEARPDWTPAEVLPYLSHALDVFGPGRCMYASDWPVATLRTSYEAWADVVLDSILELPPEDVESVLGGTASCTYGLADSRTATEGSDDARCTVRRR